MNQEPRPQHAFGCLHPDDFWLFLDARTVAKQHRTRQVIDDAAHERGPRRRCQECRVLALGGLLAFAGRARERGWTRAEALADLDAHPATYDSMVKEGRRREGPAAGLLAKPYDAAFGSTYTAALEAADEAGELSVAVRAAQELLGFVITAVQDPDGGIDRGQMVAWEAIEDRLASGPYPLPAGLRAWHVWDEVVAACDAVPRAANLLDDHVFRCSAGASRHTARRPKGDDAGHDAIADAADPGWGGRDADDAVGAIVVREAAERLVGAGTASEAASRAAVRRVLAERFGPDVARAASGGIRSLAADVLALARRELALLEVARHLEQGQGAHPSSAPSGVEAAFERWQLAHPYDLGTDDGRALHARWLAVAARDATSVLAGPTPRSTRQGR
jgi:hypothetical protein